MNQISNTRAGGYTFRISGSIYHRIDTLMPQNGQQAVVEQIYFCDSSDTTRIRRNIFNELLACLLNELNRCFLQHNALL